MSIEAFIDENRETIDAAIRRAISAGRNIPFEMELGDDERADWIANDEGLYNWAIDEGVDV